MLRRAESTLPQDTTLDELRDTLTREREYIDWLIRRVRDLTEVAVGIRVYDVTEAAKVLRTNRDQIYAYIRSGRLKAFTLEEGARKYLIQDSDLQALIDSRKVAS